MKYGLGTILGLIAGRTVGLLYPPVRRESDYLINTDWANIINEPPELVGLLRRGIIDESKFYTQMLKHGFGKEAASQVYWLSEQLASAAEMVDLFYRNEIDKSEYYLRLEQVGIEAKLANELLRLKEVRLDPETIIRAWRRQIQILGQKPDYFDDLRHQGWSDDRIELLKKVTEYFPSPADLITFAVREVYTPEIVEKYGQMEDLPPKFLEEAKKAGLPEEQAKNYWAAHWILPSVGQGYEMLHRGVIDEEGLMTLMRTQDIMPFWRDKLMKISYSPLTRVDVRRMNKLGILDEAGVKKSYMDIGYNEENAQLMTDFTLAYNENTEEAEKTESDKRKEELKGLSRTVIISRYKKGSVDVDTAKGWLQDIGLADEVIDFYIAQADFENDSDIEEQYITAYKRMYVNGIIDYNKTSDLLDELNIPAKQKENLLYLWDLEKVSKSSQPSKAELINFRKKGLITLDGFKSMMSDLGYASYFIDLYVDYNNLAEAQ